MNSKEIKHEDFKESPNTSPIEVKGSTNVPVDPYNTTVFRPWDTAWLYLTEYAKYLTSKHKKCKKPLSKKKQNKRINKISDIVLDSMNVCFEPLGIKFTMKIGGSPTRLFLDCSLFKSDYAGALFIKYKQDEECFEIIVRYLIGTENSEKTFIIKRSDIKNIDHESDFIYYIQKHILVYIFNTHSRVVHDGSAQEHNLARSLNSCVVRYLKDRYDEHYKGL